MSSQPDVQVRFKVPLIFAIPIGALVVIGGAAFGFSRILLELEPEAATAVAFTMAVNILIACAIVANKPRLDTVTMAELFVVVTYPVLIGIVLAQVGFGGGAEHAVEGTANHGGGATTSLSAAGVAFDTSELAFTAGEPATLPFANEDTVPHNFSIYEDDAATKDLFVGAEVPGGSSTEYEIPPLDKGEYFFRCDLHPTSMTGTATVT